MEGRGDGPLPLPPGGGILVIDKPRGPSSHQVTAWAGEILGQKVGHAGTLDPGVSGVLVVMVGKAVGLAPVLLAHDKEYVAVVRVHANVEETDLRRVCSEFCGRIYQRPPRRSAVSRSLRIRTVQALDLLEYAGRVAVLRITCDAGTYIRSLCHHMGLALGCGAHMQELRRTRSGPYREDCAHTLFELRDAADAFREGDEEHLRRLILRPETAVACLPPVVIRDSAVDALCHGAALAGVGITSRGSFGRGDLVAVFTGRGELVCIGEALVPSAGVIPGKPGLVVAPRRVFLARGTYPPGWKKGKEGKGA
ncbi:MAG: RNA-guided pseudouridylation complex pseudouridine synthase subunit Cbf5 [Methanolinea sp.]|nr:RNA-guided pseudouridylation complex pseudouridine synthase subunit Cbf5 [Methanolinea sp.]